VDDDELSDPEELPAPPRGVPWLVGPLDDVTLRGTDGKERPITKVLYSKVKPTATGTTAGLEEHVVVASGDEVHVCMITDYEDKNLRAIGPADNIRLIGAFLEEYGEDKKVTKAKINVAIRASVGKTDHKYLQPAVDIFGVKNGTVPFVSTETIEKVRADDARAKEARLARKRKKEAADEMAEAEPEKTKEGKKAEPEKTKEGKKAEPEKAEPEKAEPEKAKEDKKVKAGKKNKAEKKIKVEKKVGEEEEDEPMICIVPKVVAKTATSPFEKKGDRVPARANGGTLAVNRGLPGGKDNAPVKRSSAGSASGKPTKRAKYCYTITADTYDGLARAIAEASQPGRFSVVYEAGSADALP